MHRDARTGKFEVEPRGRGRAPHALPLALALAWAPSIARAEEAGLSIETGSPDALCPDLASTRAAVRRRLGELIVPGGSSAFRARYTIGHAPVGSPRDFVRLELFGPDGGLQLSRELPLEGESCSTMAEVIALVLDRHFRALLAREPAPAEGSSAAPAAAMPPAQPAARTPAAAPASASPSPAAARDAAPTPLPDRSLELVAFELGWRGPEAPALGLRATFAPWPHVYLGAALRAGLLPNSEDLSGGGEVSSRDVSLCAHAGWGPELGHLRLYAGPGLCLGIERGSARDLERAVVGYRATWAAGLHAGTAWVTSDRWSFGLTAALDVSIAELGGRFYVDGQEVLEPKQLRAWLGMNVGYDF